MFANVVVSMQKRCGVVRARTRCEFQCAQARAASTRSALFVCVSGGVRVRVRVRARDMHVRVCVCPCRAKAHKP